MNIARDTIDFLGVTWNKGQLSIPEAKLQAFRDIPIPNTPKKMKSVLCTLSYYRRFVPRFANLTQELMTPTTVHPKQFHLTDNHKKQFKEIIHTMCANMSIYLLDPNKPLYVQKDPSQFCGAGKVFQKNDNDYEQLVACISKKFTKTEQHYSTINFRYPQAQIPVSNPDIWDHTLSSGQRNSIMHSGRPDQRQREPRTLHKSH